MASELCARVRAEERLRPEQRMTPSLNFALLGNPGTGKTVCSRLLASILHGAACRLEHPMLGASPHLLCGTDIGIRDSAEFEACTGGELLRNGPDSFKEILGTLLCQWTRTRSQLASQP